MCDPVSIGVVTTLASTAFSVAQARQQSVDKQATAEYNTRVSENEAQSIRNQATEAENAQRLKTARLLGKQRAQLGAANINFGSGSALQLQEDTVTLGEADALRIRTTGDDQFTASMQQAELETAKGEAADTQEGFDIAGSLLSGAAGITGTGVADKWFTESSAGNTSPFKTKSNSLGLTAGQGL